MQTAAGSEAAPQLDACKTQKIAEHSILSGVAVDDLIDAADLPVPHCMYSSVWNARPQANMGMHRGMG